MAYDIRYSELRFLQAVASGAIEIFNSIDTKQTNAVGLTGNLYVEMAAALIEDLFVRFQKDQAQLYVLRLRGDLPPTHKAPAYAPPYTWENPRAAVENLLNGCGPVSGLQRLQITYRGLRRIEELRDLLRDQTVLEDFGVLLSSRYFRRDLNDALRRNPDVEVSVLYADMDDFGNINKKFGQMAGDVVMKAYLEAVRDGLGPLGTAYRGVGDEVMALIVGQGHEGAMELAESIRKRINTISCEFNKKPLPKVTASIGVATTPPDARTADIESLADQRKLAAKEAGKDRVVGANVQ